MLETFSTAFETFESNASESCGTGVGNSVRPDVRTGGRWIKYFDGDIQQQQVIMDGPAQQRLTGVDKIHWIWQNMGSNILGLMTIAKKLFVCSMY